ncbi:MAG: OmpA family protein, partial [Proteobacteria bacterium]|nr:OmpA family protein [Pseudomonadota bacterium]
AGAGDLGARVRVAPVRLQYFDAGVRFGVDLPTGTREAWMGEEGLRSSAGLLLRPHVGPVALLVDVGATARTAVDTDADFALGSELSWGSALRGEVWSDRAWLFGGVVGRSGFSAFLAGGAENAAEGLGGVQLAFGEAWEVDLGYGQGLSEGYGTSEQRYFGALVWIPQEREPEPVIVVVEEPEDSWLPPPEPESEEEGPPAWEPEELARVVDEVIEIRDPIQFEFATSVIKDESLPVLRAVGDLMLAEERLEHVVVEGHASEEGSHDFNYELSTDRARAVWEQLLQVGVHADRVSFRGLGEVVPRTAGEQEEELAENRRVEFHIVRQLDPLELVPAHDRAVPLPWERLPPEDEGTPDEEGAP